MNKVGVGSLLFGLILVLAVWFLVFAPPAHSAGFTAGLYNLVATTFVGGVVLFGLFLMLIGLLILVI